MQKYRRVTNSDRCHISAWLQDNISICEISKRLGFHKSTIYREITRNSSASRGYQASPAGLRSKRRYRACRKKYKLKGKILKRVSQYLKDDWSPQQISERFKDDDLASISHECIYKYVRTNKEALRPHLRRLCRKKGAGRHRQRGKHKNSFQPNISERPEAANNRTQLGHWERDIMFAGSKTPILVSVDRKSRYVKINRADDLKAKTVNKLTLKQIYKFKYKAKTVTSDRGTEFKVPLKEIKTYYCDAQAPQQRGTVENTIGLIRQYIKRNTEPEKITNKYLKQIEKKLNNRPRKVLDYWTPIEVINNKKVALAS